MEGDQQDEHAEQEDRQDHEREPVGDLGGEVDVAGRRAADEGEHAVAGALGNHARPQVLDQVRGCRVGRRRGRDHRVDGRVPGLVELRRRDERSPLVAVRAFCSLTRRGSVPRSSPPALVSVFTNSLWSFLACFCCFAAFACSASSWAFCF